MEVILLKWTQIQLDRGSRRGIPSPAFTLPKRGGETHEILPGPSA